MKVRLLQFLAIVLIMASCSQAQWNWGQTTGQQLPTGSPTTYSTFGSTNNNQTGITLNNNALNPATSTNNYYQRTVAVDGSGNSYIAVSYDSSDIYIGSSANPVSAVGKRTICLYKLNSSGTLQWYRRIGAGFGYCEVNSIVLDQANNKIVMSGNFYLDISPNTGQTAISFETNTPGTFTNPFNCSDTYYNSEDGFVACFTTAGAFQWANQVTLQNVANFSSGSGGIELMGGIGADGLGNYYVGGITQRYDMQVKGVSTLNWNRWGSDSSFYSANGDLNSYMSNSWVGGPSLAGKNISALLYSSYLVAASGTQLYMSYDYGVNWRQIDNGAFSSNITAINGSSSGYMVSNSNGLYYGINTTSTSAGIDWLNISTTPNIECVNYYSGIANTVYGTSDAGLYYCYNGTTTGGISWIQADGFSSHNIVSVFEANSGKTLLAGVSGDGIWYSTRGSTTIPFGSSWAKATGIYNQNVYCVNSMIGSPGYLLAGADSGIYVSYTSSPSENGTAWHKSGPGPIYSDASVLLPVTSAYGYNYSDPVYNYNYKIVAGTSQGAYVTYSLNGGDTWTPWAKVGNGLNGQSIPINGIQVYNTRLTFFATPSSGIIASTWTGLVNNISSATVYAPFVFIKFNSSGQAQWMTAPKTWNNESSASNCMINDIVADNSGCYVSFCNAANYGLIFSNPDISYLKVLTNTNNYNNYYAKFDQSGKPLWAHMMGLPVTYPSSDSKRNDLLSFALDGSGNLFAAGYSQSSSILIDGISALTNPNPLENCLLLGKFSTSTGNCTWATVDGYGINTTNGAWLTSIGMNPSTHNILVSGSARGIGFTLANSVITPPLSGKYTGFLAAYHDNGSSVSPINAVQLSPSAANDVFSGNLSVNGTNVAMTGEFDNDNLTLLGVNYPKQATGNNSQENFFVLNGTYNNSLFAFGNAPTLTSPANNATGVTSNNVLFQWNPVGGATAYQLIVYSNSAQVYNNASVSYDTITVTSMALTNNKTYTWSVRAFVSGAWTDFSPTWTFTSSSASALPGNATLSSPANNATVANPVLFSWSAVTSPNPDSIKYHVQVFSDTTYSTLVFDSPLMYNQTSLYVNSLTTGTRYFARIQASNSAGVSAWSNSQASSRSFVVSYPLPVAPTLTTPVDGTTGVAVGGTTTKFTATNVTNGYTYSTIYSTKPDFSSGSVTRTTTWAFDTISNSAQFASATIYYWHTQAININGSSTGSGPFSGVNRFATTGAAAPTAPTLSSPANLATNWGINQGVSWSLASGTLPETLELQVALDAGFTSIVYDNANILGSATSFAAFTLTPNTTYYWRMSGTNFIGTGAWSGSRSFTTSSIYINPITIIQGYYNSINNTMALRDTVTIELHNATSPYALVESHKAVFDSVTNSGNGTILGRSSSFFTSAVIGTSYYLVVKFRNAIETWSANPYPIPLTGSFNYNFTDNQSEAYGSNLIQVGTVWCIYSGDVNQDGYVTADDYTGVDNDNSNFSYDLVYDINGDGYVTADDYTCIDNNNTNFIQIQAPAGATIPSVKRVHHSRVQPNSSVQQKSTLSK